jgi:uncharacterized protein with ParB-like and HNH nuclease domain
VKTDNSSVADLFNNDLFYEIPEFQRPFSWEKDQFEDLIDDLASADGTKEYFLGTIVYYKDDGVRMVVDGQQRLTSLMILLACLRDRIADEKTKSDLQNLIIQPEDKVRDISERDRLVVRDHDMFHKMIAVKDGTLTKFDVRDFDEPSSRYIVARDVFAERLDKLDQPTLTKLMKFVSNKCLMIYLEADTFEEAFKLFEIVNDRGKQLRRIDLLKSYNLHPDFVPNKIKRKQLAQQWDQDEASLGERKFEALFNILRLIYTKSKPAEDLFSEFRKRIFDTGKLSRGADFFTAVSDYVSLYAAIFDDRDFLKGDALEGHFRALMSIMDSEFFTFEWRACVLSFAKKFGRDGVYQFCLAIEKLVLFHAIEGVRKDERYSDFTSILSAIEKAKDPDVAIGAIKVDLQRIEQHLATEDVYKKPFEKYVLLRLELAVAELKAIREFTAKTTEHVFPQTPLPGGDWDKAATEEERKKFVNKLGNLVLLSQGKNSSASNREFVEKKKTYLSPRVSDFPRSNQVLGYEKWTREIIEERSKEGAKLVLQDPAVP